MGRFDTVDIELETLWAAAIVIRLLEDFQVWAMDDLATTVAEERNICHHEAVSAIEDAFLLIDTDDAYLCSGPEENCRFVKLAPDPVDFTAAAGV